MCRLPGCKSSKSDVCVLDENLEKVGLFALKKELP